MVLNDLQGHYDLVSMLLSAKPDLNEALDEFRHLLKKDYMEYANVDDAYSENAEILAELQNINLELEFFSRNKDFYNKNLIALAGDFGSGKSTFCNSLFCTNDIALPVNDSPRTMIPAYVVSDNVLDVFGLTVTGATVELGVDVYKQMDCDFIRSFGFDLKNLMNAVVVHAPMPKGLEHICFVEMPGRLFIRQAKMFFWFVNLEVADSLAESDLDFLQNIRSNVPEIRIAVICNKADYKSPYDIDYLLNNVVRVLNDYSIPCEGVVAYSSLLKKSYGYRGKSLDAIFNEMNRLAMDKKKELQKRLKSLFRKHVNADADRIQKSFDRIDILDKVLKLVKPMACADEQHRETLEFVVRDFALQKANLERDLEKYNDNKDTALRLATKMDGAISTIFNGFEEITDDMFVRIPAGSFVMGSDAGPRDSKPTHPVKLDSFMMKTTPVTQAEWRKIMGESFPSWIKGDSWPVCGVSFSQVTKFCNKLSEIEMLIPCYDEKGNCNFDANGYRLPTEAEWEYAAKSCGDIPLRKCAWYKENSDGLVHPVAQKEENAFGLFDMLGNVYEWVNDFWADYSAVDQTNPHGPANGDERVIRGGSYKSSENSCMVTARNMADEKNIVLPIGFRVVRRV